MEQRGSLWQGGLHWLCELMKELGVCWVQGAVPSETRAEWVGIRSKEEAGDRVSESTLTTANVSAYMYRLKVWQPCLRWENREYIKGCGSIFFRLHTLATVQGTLICTKIKKFNQHNIHFIAHKRQLQKHSTLLSHTFGAGSQPCWLTALNIFFTKKT